MDSIYLISCAARKKARAAPARELYVSPLFKLSARYAEQSGEQWFILSAKYGLVDPDAEIEPYDQTLNTMGSADRKGWAEMVRAQMDDRIPEAERVVVLAGTRYREGLDGYLRSRFPTVEVPLKGLRIGEQLRWLKHGQV